LPLRGSQELQRAATLAQSAYYSYSKESSEDSWNGFEGKLEDVLGKDQFGFTRGKGIWDATRILRIISERMLDTNEKLCAFFIS
jgi:hypothetical protein